LVCLKVVVLGSRWPIAIREEAEQIEEGEETRGENRMPSPVGRGGHAVEDEVQTRGLIVQDGMSHDADLRRMLSFHSWRERRGGRGEEGRRLKFL